LPSLKYEIQVIGVVIISLITKRTTNNSVLGRLAKNFIRNTPTTTWWRHDANLRWYCEANAL